MRTSTTLIMLVALVLCTVPAVTVQAQQAGSTSFDVAGTDAAKVEAFLKCLKTSIAVDNRLKVGSLFNYPVEAWVEGKVVTIRNASELQTHYSHMFDASLRQVIADAKLDALVANQQGVMISNGRILVAPVGSKATLKITKISEPQG